MELRWEDDETLRLELASSASGCVLTLINRFDEIGKAARDAAGWHACLDALEAWLDGAPVPDDRWSEVHPGYVSRFGPEAATLGPPTRPDGSTAGRVGCVRSLTSSTLTAATPRPARAGPR